MEFSQNAAGAAVRRQVNRRHITHHQQVGQRFMEVAVNEHRILLAGLVYILTILSEVPLVTI
ncbi:hypothetical protein [Sodalis-like endosymbiont of Proechinophthirus fluctus]|uniref:hypothetical protein n=1 Tax=Sodalis-like endosymbiont of Proechinophthirus fluctus TaxID=1462730 RepID=UPI001FCCA08A|nr:hypothetical protein [Sodalis-like endosymbiont of Proechinophthirus fluctus]